MDILIKTEILISALQNVISVIDKSFTKPILSNFMIQTLENEGEQGMVEFSATDYELSIIERIPAQIKTSGSICINAKRVFDITREFRAEEIHIRSTEQLWVQITCGASELRLPSVEVGLYPQPKIEELNQQLKISALDLAQCIDLTLFASQTNESRRNLMGVALSMTEDQRTRWQATDGHRLAQVIQPVEEMNFGEVTEIILPRKALMEIRKVCDLMGEMVDITFDERVAQFSGNRIHFKTRLIEGKFPNCDPIIPKDNDLRATIHRENLIHSLRIVSAISTEKLRPVKLNLEANQLKLESEKTEFGEASDEFTVNYDGKPFEIGFNTRYLLDVLNVMKSEEIQMEFKNSMSPSVIREPNNDIFLSVLMPLRTEW
ncbi:MAG: DNA polymerase III subunit beta [SAR324 cluster bacterium]|jgi:DNA polymerase-3 subunit beta|nr:DNA polymerase III subunit beta [SAR324 cluster bacterium]MDP6245435.1 DNA polymerase III subunit beta [SAR324 cluster bacterium]MDP6462849.1 DNA polymerase III subunit beta [SAR324 cluster bacterium]MDP7139097.1 DNA polymerase III subunit beta [SAR324 cluster bacterium]MDP7335632.1 DNA polymerase III subunit beta [SAR324 cluster bacterium]|tara:strand:+ start:98 stop:1225 length:1128 start_codon:yes stop_codon:yes gene_type:complete